MWRSVGPGAAKGLFRLCGNYETQSVCNWIVPQPDPGSFCRSCRLNRIIPNLQDPKNKKLWKRVEQAKRRLIYTLLELGLPVEASNRLGFEFLADPNPNPEFADLLGPDHHVMTGHREGIITINIAEADHSAREEIREKMNEQYRTLLGHFRHEIGHYYWFQVVAGTPWLEPVRALFGDERHDYAPALKHYYANGPTADWPERFISAYASAHPWEDWAESWAHYLHMFDTLETARDYGFFIAGRPMTRPAAAPAPDAQYAFDPACAFDALLDDWIQLTSVMNALNRSMGLSDAYPFALSQTAAAKLRMVHQVIGGKTV